jgi:ribosomal protein S18 acetylase RimI-like enzyme
MMEIRRLRAGDEASAIAAIHRLKPAAERPGHDASPEHMRELLARDENYLYIASVETVPVGFLLAYRVPRVDRDQDMIYLYEIGVLPEHRRRGIGSKMVQLLKEECRSRNVMEVWVGTEADNVAARALYESTGAKCQGETYAEYSYEEF